MAVFSAHLSEAKFIYAVIAEKREENQESSLICKEKIKACRGNPRSGPEETP